MTDPIPSVARSSEPLAASIASDPAAGSASVAWEPYHLSVLVGGRVIDFHKPLPDPFHSTEVTVGWRDLLRGLLRRRLVVSVSVGADRETVESVLALNPDHLGDADSPSRNAWNASLNQMLGSVKNGPAQESY